MRQKYITHWKWLLSWVLLFAGP